MHVYVHGNCQAPALARLIAEQLPEWTVNSYEVFGNEIIDEISRFRQIVKTSDIIVSQPIHDGYRKREDLSLNWLRASAKQSAQFVVFPSMFFEGQLVGCRSIRIPGYGMDYHDALLIHLVLSNVTPQNITNILLADDLYSQQFVSQEIALSLAEMRRRELVDDVDIPLSPFVENYAAANQLFHVINHPCRPALVFVANGILTHLGYDAKISSTGKDCLPFPHIPCLPSVMKFMRDHSHGQKEWEIQDPDCYHLPAQKLSAHDYIDRAIGHLKQYANDELVACLKEREHARTFLERVAINIPWIPEIEAWLPRVKHDYSS